MHPLPVVILMPDVDAAATAQPLDCSWNDDAVLLQCYTLMLSSRDCVGTM